MGWSGRASAETAHGRGGKAEDHLVRVLNEQIERRRQRGMTDEGAQPEAKRQRRPQRSAEKEWSKALP
jgi:hypothetical protein